MDKRLNPLTYFLIDFSIYNNYFGLKKCFPGLCTVGYYTFARLLSFATVRKLLKNNTGFVVRFNEVYSIQQSKSVLLRYPIIMIIGLV